MAGLSVQKAAIATARKLKHAVVALVDDETCYFIALPLFKG